VLRLSACATVPKQAVSGKKDSAEKNIALIENESAQNWSQEKCCSGDGPWGELPESAWRNTTSPGSFDAHSISRFAGSVVLAQDDSLWRRAHVAT
jgi:hypothetical protein